MRLLKLQNNNKEIRKLSSEKLPDGREDIEEVLYYQSLLYVSKVIYIKLISRYYDNPLADHFGIKKTNLKADSQEVLWANAQKRC